MKSKNYYLDLFMQFLDLTEFELIVNKRKRDNSYCLSLNDLQGANLGDIESEVFNTPEEILDRMEIYENDYIIEDIYDTLDEYYQGYFSYKDWENLLRQAKEYNKKVPEIKQVGTEFLEMIINAKNIPELNNYSIIKYLKDKNLLNENEIEIYEEEN